jgi:hypothetical protein
MTQEWKDKYVASWTSLSGAFGGSVEAPMAAISYLNMDLYLDPSVFRTVLQSYVNKILREKID